jgi:hypothetical protein
MNGQFTKSIINLGAPMLYFGNYIGTRDIYIVLTYSIDKKIGTKYTILLSMTLCTTGISLGGFWANSYFVVVVFGLFVGLGCGILSICSLWPCWNHFGSTNSKITGIIVVGFSIGSGIYGVIFTYLVNPHNYTPPGDKSYDMIYPDSVSSQVPKGFFLLSVITLAIGILSWLMISYKPATPSEEEKILNEPRSYKEIITSNNFLRLFIILYFSCFVVNFWVIDYKIIALYKLYDDHLVANVFILSNVFGNLGQILWMFVLDYTSFKFLFVLGNMLNFIFTVTLPMIWDEPIVFISWICILNFICGGFYPAIIVEVFKEFPGEEGKKTLPLMTLPWVICTFTMTGITEIGDELGYDVASYVLSIMPIIAIIIHLSWKQKQQVLSVSLDLSESLISPLSS